MIFASDGTPRIGRLTVNATPQILALDTPQKNSQGVLLKVLGEDETVFIGTGPNISPTAGSYPVSSGEEFSINLRETHVLWVVASSDVEIAWCAL